jgi:hypothetical protein
MTSGHTAHLAKRSALAALLLIGLSAAAEEDRFPFSPALPPPLGRIDISADGADPVQVFVDGELVADRTPTIITVPAGDITLVLKKAGYADFEEMVTIESLETLTLRREMTPQ